jgi:hypothetical protein
MQTIETADLEHVIGGNGLLRLAGRAGRAVYNAFRPAKPLTDAANTAAYASDLGKIGAAGAGAVELGGRAVNGTSPLGLPGGTPTPAPSTGGGQ